MRLTGRDTHWLFFEDLVTFLNCSTSYSIILFRDLSRLEELVQSLDYLPLVLVLIDEKDKKSCRG